MAISHDFRVMIRTEERGKPVPVVEDLRAHFSMFGQILDAHCPARAPDMGFVTFGSMGELQAALMETHPVIAGIQVNLQQAMPKSNQGGGGGGGGGGGAPGGPPMMMQQQHHHQQHHQQQHQMGMGMGMGNGMGMGMQQQQMQMHQMQHQQMNNNSSNEFRIMIRTEERGMSIPMVDDIRAHFSMYGQVSDVHTTPRNNDMAFVSFASAGSLQDAMMDRHPLVAGVQCNVQQAQPKAMGPGGGGGGGGGGGMAQMGGHGMGMGMQQQHPQVMNPFQGQMGGQSGGHDPLRLYVTRLDGSIDEDMLRTYFNYFGPVRDAYIPADKNSLQKLPYAFVTMESPVDAQSILQFPSHQITEQCNINVCAAQAKNNPGGGGGLSGVSAVLAPGGFGPMMQGQQAAQMGGMMMAPKQGVPGDNRLYIFGMPAGLNMDHLRGHFARFGEIWDVHVPPKKPDNAYITFGSNEALQDALANSGLCVAGYMVQGMKEAVPKDNVRRGPPGRSAPY